jgi:hypothetical protein
MRNPSKAEIEELTAYLHLENLNDLGYAEIEAHVKEATIGVFDNYISDSPGYTGKLMVVIWGYPEMYELYQWDQQLMIARVKQDDCLKDI